MALALVGVIGITAVVSFTAFQPPPWVYLLLVAYATIKYPLWVLALMCVVALGALLLYDERLRREEERRRRLEEERRRLQRWQWLRSAGSSVAAAGAVVGTGALILLTAAHPRELIGQAGENNGACSRAADRSAVRKAMRSAVMDRMYLYKADWKERNGNSKCPQCKNGPFVPTVDHFPKSFQLIADTFLNQQSYTFTERDLCSAYRDGAMRVRFARGDSGLEAWVAAWKEHHKRHKLRILCEDCNRKNGNYGYKG
eukprot:TRINITY_DN7306_c0_g1_i6.p1 TRINITY_DN7306_c0_g1~~TRINITY_DN7306_c0_g1_i6.p1  ORF type:complete len:256 (+),score=27.05 TRINITY_DN7306_c0_g1_i6:285-1052(+)